MFGQQNNQPANDQIPDQSIDGALSETNTITPTLPTPVPDPASPAAPTSDDSQATEGWQHPGLPLDPAQAATAQAAVPKPVYSDNIQVGADPTYTANDLIDIKQKALHELSPLVGHLDQTPEEKFKTTMMMIQASDDQSLVKTAYEAAGHIEDEKLRAQALLDIVNEINYFTAHHPTDQA